MAGRVSGFTTPPAAVVVPRRTGRGILFERPLMMAQGRSPAGAGAYNAHSPDRCNRFAGIIPKKNDYTFGNPPAGLRLSQGCPAGRCGESSVSRGSPKKSPRPGPLPGNFLDVVRMHFFVA